MTVVYMFPGQNSRYPEMIHRLRQWTGCDRILLEASEILGRDLAAHYEPNNPEMFACNRDVQVGVFLAGYILSQWLAEEGVHPDASLGLSLGEYNHLVQIGALSFSSALRLLEARGQAYENGTRGLMMSVFPCEPRQVEEALMAAGHRGIVDVSIQFTPKHVVLGGEAEAVQAAGAWLEDDAFAQTRIIDYALPMHTRFFRPAAEEFREALQQTDWQTPQQTYLPNVDGAVRENASREDISDCLYRHVFNTVQWTKSMETIVTKFPDAWLIEVGPRCVVSNAVRREYKKMRCLATDDPDSNQPVLMNTIRALRASSSQTGAA
jgi:[acyl-carrier-protein] S-malonyltransferase